jgi:hypothetical protein
VDDIGASYRTHTTEQVGFAAFETPLAYPPGCSSDAQCSDGAFCNGVEHCVAGNCLSGTNPCGTNTCDEASDQCISPAIPKLEASTVLVGTSSVAVSLKNVYTSPVVVTSIRYANNTNPVVPRVGNVTPTGFEIYLQSPNGLPVVADTVSYIVVEEGVWNIDGLKIEAHKYVSTVTDTQTTAVGNMQTYGQAYAYPVVLGQVMSVNDSRWSMFWCSGTDLDSPPTPTSLRTGKRIDNDPAGTRENETVGYIVVESGHRTVGGVAFDAKVGGDTVMSVVDGAPYKYTFIAPFVGIPQIAVVTQAGRDGGEGGWAYTYGAAPYTKTTISLAVDDIGASYRTHTTEQVGFAAFEKAAQYPVP